MTNLHFIVYRLDWCDVWLRDSALNYGGKNIFCCCNGSKTVMGIIKLDLLE